MHALCVVSGRLSRARVPHFASLRLGGAGGRRQSQADISLARHETDGPAAPLQLASFRWRLFRYFAMVALSFCVTVC